MARSQGGRPERGGTPREGTEKAWPLLCSDGSHLLGVQSESDAGGDAGALWGDGGVVRLPRLVSDRKRMLFHDAGEL